MLPAVSLRPNPQILPTGDLMNANSRRQQRSTSRLLTSPLYLSVFDAAPVTKPLLLVWGLSHGFWNRVQRNFSFTYNLENDQHYTCAVNKCNIKDLVSANWTLASQHGSWHLWNIAPVCRGQRGHTVLPYQSQKTICWSPAWQIKAITSFVLLRRCETDLLVHSKPDVSNYVWRKARLKIHGSADVA